MRPNTEGDLSILVFAFMFAMILLPAIQAQFRFQDTIFDPTPQADPLRKVFGIWGRLLNRMAQQNPPSDDELHLKGASEGGEEGNDNSLGEEAMPPSQQQLGIDRTKPSSGADRIIDEGKLNELLPRLHPNGQPTTTTTTSTTITTSTTASSTTTAATTTTMEPAKTSTTIVEETTTAKKRKKKIMGNKSSAIAKTNNATKVERPKITSPSTTTTAAAGKRQISSKIPPMTILKDGDSSKEDAAQVVGATIRLRTSSEKGGGSEVAALPVEQSEGIRGGGNLNDSMLTRMENETAQLIAEIENVLADAEVGPNGGHWLRENGERNTTTTTGSTTRRMATTTKSEEKSAEEGNEEEEDEDEGEVEKEQGGEEERDDEEDGEEDDGVISGEERNNATMATLAARKGTDGEETGVTKANRKLKVVLPEAEEEEQAAEIAQLQLDSSTTVVSTASPTQPLPSTTTENMTAAAAQSAQNIFNLNTNANSNANPNFSTMIRPINSVIDGIGPLILPLIGYSRQAFDAYYPQRAEGVSIFRPADFAGPMQSAQFQQPQPFARPMSGGVQIGQRPIPIPHPRQISSAQPSAQQQMMPDPPSLELLGRIIEQRRQREKERNRLQEISGSFPPNVEQKYYPPALDRIVQTEPIPTRPAPKTTTTTMAPIPAEDRGYDAGRKSVLSTFHEDSGLMVGQQQAMAPNAQKSGPQPSSALNAGDIGAGGGFGGGRRPNAAPFAA